MYGVYAASRWHCNAALHPARLKRVLNPCLYINIDYLKFCGECTAQHFWQCSALQQPWPTSLWWPDSLIYQLLASSQLLVKLVSATCWQNKRVKWQGHKHPWTKCPPDTITVCGQNCVNSWPWRWWLGNKDVLSDVSGRPVSTSILYHMRSSNIHSFTVRGYVRGDLVSKGHGLRSLQWPANDTEVSFSIWFRFLTNSRMSPPDHGGRWWQENKQTKETPVEKKKNMSVYTNTYF